MIPEELATVLHELIDLVVWPTDSDAHKAHKIIVDITMTTVGG